MQDESTKKSKIADTAAKSFRKTRIRIGFCDLIVKKRVFTLVALLSFIHQQHPFLPRKAPVLIAQTRFPVRIPCFFLKNYGKILNFQERKYTLFEVYVNFIQFFRQISFFEKSQFFAREYSVCKKWCHRFLEVYDKC